MLYRSYLKSPGPALSSPAQTVTPWRLVVSRKLADYTLAFVSLIFNNQVSTHAEVSALWAVGYLEGKLPSQHVGALLRDQRQMDADVTVMNTFMARRYLGPKEVLDAAREIHDHIDTMMMDLGLQTDRNRMRMAPGWTDYQAWKAEWFAPYMPQDYVEVVKECLGR